MKKITALLTLALLAMGAFAQADAIAQYFPEIEADENTTRVTISSKMFEMFMHVEPESPEERELLETISDLQGLRIVTKDELTDGMAFYKKALKKPGAEYEQLLSVSEPEENFTFFIREKNGNIHEVLMIFGDADSLVLMSIRGNINLKELSKLSRKMDVEGMKYLDHLDDEERN